MGLTDYLPQAEGLLPKWMLFISAVAVFNSVQCYFGGVKLSRRVYERKPQEVTALSARTFGTWTMLSSIIRLYAAYNIHERVAYDIALWSYVLAETHFVSEWLVFGTAKFGKGLLGPLVVATLTTSWMYLQRDFYVLIN